MVLDITEGEFDTKLAPTLDQFANQWEFSPDIEINGPDEGSGPNLQHTAVHRLPERVPVHELQLVV